MTADSYGDAQREYLRNSKSPEYEELARRYDVGHSITQGLEMAKSGG